MGYSRALANGFSMIEVMIATAIYSMGLGSVSLLMLAAINGTSQARYQTVATTQAVSMAEIIAMSSDAYGHYVDPQEAGDPACEEAGCGGGAIAAANLQHWEAHLSETLPGGTGLVCRDSTPEDGSAADPQCDGAGALVIKIFWNGLLDENAAEAVARRLVSRLPW